MADQRHWPTGQCSGANCRATIIWAQTARERIPVDVEPGSWPDHNIVLTARPGGPPPLATVLTNPTKAFGRTLYRSHFATCVDAGSFRRRAQRRRPA
jgi:hypothetical protein